MTTIFNNIIFKQALLLLFLVSCLPASSQNTSSQNQPLKDSGAYFKSFDGTKIYYEVRGTGEPVFAASWFYCEWAIMEKNRII
jgi:hypothetical protein